MNEEIEKLGLTDKESRVYLAALEIGRGSVSDIARAANVKRATTHLAIESLNTQGLLSETRIGKRRTFNAVHPRRLLELANFRVSQIEDQMPGLLARYNEPKDKPKIQTFEGEPGIQLIYRELFQSLAKQDEALLFTRIDAIRNVPKSIYEYKRMLRSIKNPKIRELNFDNPEAVKWTKEIKPLRGKNHFIRILPNTFEFGFNDNLIMGNKLVIFSLKGDIFATSIESADVVKTYRALFEWAWKQGKDAY